MESRDVVILAIIISTCHKIDAKLNVIPRDTEVKINDSTYINCSTSLQADQVQWRHGNNYVYTGIAILEPYNDGRFSVEINALTGACNLVVRSVQPSDAGTYECADDEGSGDRRSVQLIVLDADPICKSNTHSDGVIGPNSCGVEPEEIKLSCSVTYHGNIPPILQWIESGDNKSVRDVLFDITFKNNEVTYKLTMNSTLDLNNASFICEATRTSDRQYSCSSDIIKIMHVFSSEVKVNMTMNDEVNCSANTSQLCSYKWKWFSGDDISKESDNQTLKPKKVGLHRCEATCLFENRLCTVEVMYAEVFQTEVQSIHAEVHSDSLTEVYSEAAKNGQNWMSLLALLLVPVAIVAVVYCRRKRKIEKSKNKNIKEVEGQQQRLLDGLPEKYKTDPVLIQTITTKPAEKEKQQIRGLTILDRELFVVSKWNSSVEVYDSIKFTFSRRWNLPELIRAQDIVSCSRNKCLYINGYKDTNQPSEILKINPSGKLIKKWSTGYEWGLSLSVTDKSNITLTIFLKNKLNEYSPDGQLNREINLSSEADVRCPSHALKLTNGHFVVSHGDIRDDLHRVCIVDADGKLKKSFGGNLGSNIGQINGPSHLFVDGNGFVMVADRGNSRVLLLDSDLELKRVILSKQKDELRFVMRILLDESNGRLFVADNEHGYDGRILVFQFCV